MSPEQVDFASKRIEMVQQQIEGRGIVDTAVLHAMRTVPREAFVMEGYEHLAYDDTPLPLPGRQTISQPYVVSLMISALQLRPSDHVLEIGTGSGYAAALLSRIVAEVHTVERKNILVNYARKRLSDLNYDNVFVHQGDGTLGWPQNAPYDAIIVAAGGPIVPPTLQSQLTIGGRLVMPVGNAERKQVLKLVTRVSERKYEQKKLGAVVFVPLIGEEGWEK